MATKKIAAIPAPAAKRGSGANAKKEVEEDPQASDAPAAGMAPALQRVAVVDPFPCMREWLTLVLERSGLYRVVLKVAHADALIAVLEGGAEVDLVLVDVCSADAYGTTLLAWLAEHRSALRVVAYCYPPNEGAVVRCYRGGVRALLFKDMDEAMILRAVDAVVCVGVFHTEYTQRVLLENPDGLCIEERRRSKLEAQLTPRLLEVLVAVCRSDCPSYRRVGDELGIGKRTVESHVDALLELFGAKTKGELARSALRLGLVKL